MVALRIWLRRCTAAKAFPALLAVCLVVVVSRGGWQLDWRWAFNWVPITTYLTVPAVAGLVAFDRSRLVEPTMAVLGRAAPRGSRGMVALVVASWLWFVLAWVLTLAYVTVRALSAGAVARPDPWFVMVTPVVLLAGAAFGLMIGTALPNLAGGPVAALVAYLAPLTLNRLGLPSTLVADVYTGTLIGMERVPIPVAATMAAQLLLAGACVVIASRSPALTHRRGVTSTVVVAAMVAASLLIVSVVDRRIDAWRPQDVPRQCIGDDIVVCGPAEAGPLLNIAHDSLKPAIDRLAGSGIDWQTRYVFPGRSEDAPADSGELSLQPEKLEGGRLSLEDIVYTLQTPRVCAAFFSSEPPVELMRDQGRVAEWVTARVSGPVREGRAPAAVVESYQRLSTCPPMTPDKPRPAGVVR